MLYYNLIEKEVKKIKDEEVRAFTFAAFSKADEEFWLVPCSSTGKHHPPEDNGEGGLIRHLVKAVAVTEQFAKREDFTPYELDLAISATLLHDIKKNGVPWGKYTDYRHGIIGAKWLFNFFFNDEFARRTILDAVRYHMAPWNTSLAIDKEVKVVSVEEMNKEIQERKRGNRPHSIIETCVREADYWGSRESMSFYPGVNIDYSSGVHDSE